MRSKTTTVCVVRSVAPVSGSAQSAGSSSLAPEKSTEWREKGSRKGASNGQEQGPDGSGRKDFIEGDTGTALARMSESSDLDCPRERYSGAGFSSERTLLTVVGATRQSTCRTEMDEKWYQYVSEEKGDCRENRWE